MRIWDRTAHAMAIGGAGAFAGLAAISAVAREWGLAAALLGFSTTWYLAIMAKWFRRSRLARLPFPSPWREILRRHVRYYGRLPDDRKPLFERDVAIFIRENRFVGVDEVQVTDELKVLAAASAVMLLFGRTDREYPRISEILFYPRPFDEDYRTQGGGRDLSGLNHAYGAVVLSVPDFLKSFANERDGQHVGLHEFAHALDLEGQSWDGIPAEMPTGLVRPWSERLKAEMERAWKGKSVLRRYAGTNEAEFFAVAVETFFEKPHSLRKAKPELYEILEAYFGPPPGDRRSGFPPGPAEL